MKNHKVAALTSILLALFCASVQAAERPASGFYGGVALRDQGVERSAMSIGIPANALSLFNVAAIDEGASRALLYGGYRFGNDVSVEASVNSLDPNTLRPVDPLRRGIGVMPSSGTLGLTDVQGRSWNADLYTSWNVYRSFALYGRLGFAQADLAPTLSNQPISATDPRRLRDGVNYGVGVPYDMTSALGLRVEYGRFGRYAGEIGSTPVETDQVTFGLQFRF